ncbi:hypothetical protein KIX02_004864 [Escherichia coli]|nr:hypothetical protein [Escherichia coli]EHO1060924.1 hypothetical protein [Escherichia coli]EHP7646660.1 hypothetical protein [Escherichia coli]EHQ9107732.1 hypothetical protein [Escherichia coli]
MRNDGTLTQEEKFILLIDKYITQHRDDKKDGDYYRRLYVLFVGYHLKYFYARDQYSSSCFHVDNIIQMFIGIVSHLNVRLIRELVNSSTLLQSLNALLNYISQDVSGAESIYADLLAQYEKTRIAGAMTYTPCSGLRKRL